MSQKNKNQRGFANMLVFIIFLLTMGGAVVYFKNFPLTQAPAGESQAEQSTLKNITSPSSGTTDTNMAIEIATTTKKTNDALIKNSPSPKAINPVSITKNVSCSSLSEGDEKNYCYAYEAIEKGDASLCATILSGKIQQYCDVNIRMKGLYLTTCKSDSFLFDPVLCGKPFEKSDPKKTVWSQMEIETPGDATSTNLLLVDYSIKSQAGAKGVVSIFFDDAIVHWKVVASGDLDRKNQRIILWGKNGPGTTVTGKHKLTFRIDSFSAVKSDVEFSNIKQATTPR